MESTPRIPMEEIDEFIRVSKSEKDDSWRCRQIIGQLLGDIRKNTLRGNIRIYKQELLPYAKKIKDKKAEVMFLEAIKCWEKELAEII